MPLFDEDIHAFAGLYMEGKAHVFLDELQYSHRGGKHLRFLYDRYPAKLVISSSSGLDVALTQL